MTPSASAPLLSAAVVDTGTPPIPEAQAWVARYDGRHGPLINLAQAVPDRPPPAPFMGRLAEAAADAEATRYGPILGDTQLREAYARHATGLYGGRLAPENVAITAGCNMAFAAALMLVAKAGDQVILPAPWYFNHQMWASMLGVAVRALPCRADAGFVPSPDDAERLVDGRTKALVLVTPNNPTGAVYPPATIAAFADLCRRRGLWLVIDETYRDFLPPGMGRPHALFEDERWRANVIGLYSFSKAYGIPGYRLGAMIADALVVAELAKILDTVQICPPRAGQVPVAWGIDGLATWREENRRALHRRAEAFRRVLRQCPDWRLDSIGAYFAYVRHPFGAAPAAAVAEALAVERGLLALPGSYFGPDQDAHLRMAFANVEAATIEAIADRLRGFILP